MILSFIIVNVKYISIAGKQGWDEANYVDDDYIINDIFGKGVDGDVNGRDDEGGSVNWL